MTDRSHRQTRVRFAGLALLAMPGFLFAQSQPDGPPPPDPQPQSSTAGGGWRRVDELPPNPAEGMPQRRAPADPAYSESGPTDQYGQPVQREPRMTDPPPASTSQTGMPPAVCRLVPPRALIISASSPWVAAVTTRVCGMAVSGVLEWYGACAPAQQGNSISGFNED